MAKLAAVAVSILVASCLSMGQAQAPDAPVQTGPPVANEPSQTDNGTGEILTFHSHARQVLVTALVWKHAPKSAAWVPKEILKRYWDLAAQAAMPPVARGLSANNFRIFDNGAEQQINYFEEADFSLRDINEQWSFYQQIRGTWGNFISVDLGLAAPTAAYILGYIPPPSQSGDCHTIRVVVGDNDVVLNRDHYCSTDEADVGTVQGGKLVAQMENFAKSGKHGSFKVASRPFVFWSSRVLSLLNDKTETGIGAASTSASARNYTYVVVVHDSRAPATIQIATEYELDTNGSVRSPIEFPGAKMWDYPCPGDHPAIYVLGVVYNANGDVATRFSDRFPCRSEDNSFLMQFGFDPPVGSYGRRWVMIPSRFNSQVELHSGDYVVHVVVSDGHKFGQARMPLRVEALDGQALTISDLALNGILRCCEMLPSCRPHH